MLQVLFDELRKIDEFESNFRPTEESKKRRAEIEKAIDETVTFYKRASRTP